MRCGLVILMIAVCVLQLFAEPLQQQQPRSQLEMNQVVLDSTNVQLMLERADLLSMHGDLSEAKKILETTLERAASLDDDSLSRAIKLRIADNYLNSDKPDSAETLLQGMLAQRISEVDRIRAIDMLGIAYRYQGQFNEAMEKHETAKALIDSASHPSLFSKINLNIANVYESKADFGQAFKYFLSSIETAEAAGDSAVLAYALNSIGVTYNNYNQPDKAEYYLQRAIDINKKRNDRVGLLMATNNLANANKGLQNFEEAIILYERALKLQKEVRTETPPFRIMYNLGQLHKEMGELDRAEKYYQQSLAYCQDAGISQGLIYNYGGLANVAELRNNFPKARNYYNHALKVARQMGAGRLVILALNSLYKLEKNLDNTADALSYYEQYVALNDSLDKIARDQALAETETELNLRQQEQINELLQENQRRQEARITTQKWLIAGSAVIIIIILLLLFLLYRYNAEKKKANAELQEQRNELEEISAVKDKMLAVIAHDLRSPLAAMHGMIHLMRDDALSKDERDRMTAELNVSLTQYISMLDNLLAWAREQMNGLKLNVKTIDPVNVIDEILNNYQLQARKKGIELMKNVNTQKLRVRADENLLKLILRNLIGNSIKFTSAGDRIFVSTREEDDSVIFEVQDTGIGMPPEIQENIFSINGQSRRGTSREKGSGLGLQLCKEFVEKQQGEIYVESTEGRGTTMVFSLPKSR